MLQVGRIVLTEVNNAAKRTGLRRLGRVGLARPLASAYQTQTRRLESDAEIYAMLNRMRTTVGVAVVGAAAALSFGVDAEADRVAHSRAANATAMPMPITSSHTAIERKKRWHLFDQIGVGSFGTVRIGMCEDSGEVAAIKIVEPDQRNYATLEREIAALKLVKALGGHKNIIDLRDVYVEARKVFLVTDLVKGGELFEHIVAFGAFNENQASAIAKDIGEALSFMHRHGLVHKDIKPENILLTSRQSEKTASEPTQIGGSFVKLADFGSAGPASNTAPVDDIGTSAYLPPELLQSGICTTGCDMWALGCVLYISLCGAHPFDLEGVATDAEVEFRVKTMPVAFDFDPWQRVSSEAKDVISKLLEKDPSKRLTADELLVHPWIVAHCASANASTASTLTQLMAQAPVPLAQTHV